MGPISSFFTLANIYDPQKAQSNRLALEMGQQQLESGKLRNRIETMALADKVGGDALSLQAGKNALAQLVQNAQPNAVQPADASNAALQQQAANAVSPSMANALYPPAMQGQQPIPQQGPLNAAQPQTQQNAAAQPDMIDIPGVGKVSKSYLDANPQAADAAARMMASYQHQQGQAAAQQVATTAADLQKQMVLALKDNDQTHLDNIKEMVNSNPALQSVFKQNGMWATVNSIKLGQGNTPHEVLMYLDKDQIRRASAMKGSPLSPDEAPGYFNIKYASPQGTGVFEPDTRLKEAKRANLTDNELQDRAVKGDTEAQRLLKNRVETKTDGKSKTPEQLRAVFTDPAKGKDERARAWNDFKLSPLSTNQLMAIASDKTLTPEQNKWAQGVLDKEDKRAASRTKVTVDLRNQGKGKGDASADDFGKWTKDDKEWWFNSMKDTGQKPDFGWGKSAAKSRAQFSKEYARWARGGGISAAAAATDKEDFKANASALKDLTKREQLVGTFTNRIDSTSQVVLKLARKYQNSNSRLLNIPINKLAGMVGSGDLQSLRLAMVSLSREVAKVESGSLGIAAVPQGQSDVMDKIHDENLSIADMQKIIATGKELGRTSMGSIAQQRKELKERMSKSGPSAEAAPKAPGGKRTGTVPRTAGDYLNKWR